MTTIQHNQAQLGVGSVLHERYELTGQLGEGGFARVWEAHDRAMGHTVAVKVLSLERLAGQPELRQTVLERFAREARVAADIEHPNVVQIYEYGTLASAQPGEATPYIVMESLSGWDLEDQLFKRSPLEPARALGLFAACLDALGVAHRHGVVHKDLKPGNIFFVGPGGPNEAFRLLDFGIAFLENAAEGRLTVTGEILGTPQYLTPEYIDNQTVTPALDVYQMGLILVELLSGRPVVDASTPLACLLKHLQGDYEVPRALLDSPLGPVLRRALKRDPAERYENATAFARALRAVDAAQVPALPHGEVAMGRVETAPDTEIDVAKTTRMIVGHTGGEQPESTCQQTQLGIGGPQVSDSYINEIATMTGLSASQTHRLFELDAALEATEPVNPAAANAPAEPVEASVVRNGRGRLILAVSLLALVGAGALAVWFVGLEGVQEPVGAETSAVEESVKVEPEPEPEPVDREPKPEPGAVDREPKPEPGAVDREPEPEPGAVDREPEPEPGAVDREPEPGAVDREPDPGAVDREPEPVDREPEPGAVDREPEPKPEPEPEVVEEPEEDQPKRWNVAP